MTEADFLARWDAERRFHEAWGCAVVREVLDGLRSADPAMDVDVFVKIPPRPRIKEADSLVGKAFHRNKNYGDPYKAIEDKVGVRFVVLLASDVSKLQSAIERSGLWNWSLDKDYEADREARPLEFAYQSKHYVVRSKGPIAEDGVDIPAGTPCEIQLRTLLQHAHSELTHDNVYKVQSGAEISSGVHRTIAKSMALIEAVDDFFERAIVQLAEATAAERSAMQTLSHIYEQSLGLPPGKDRSNALVLHAMRDHLGDDLRDRIGAMLRGKPFIVDMIKRRVDRLHGYRQPWILFAYHMVDTRPNQTKDEWPLTPDEIAPVFTDLGK